jgi:small subunit ribosomal protein S18
MAIGKSGGGGRRGFMFKRMRKKRCKLCTDKREEVDFKEIDFIKGFVTERGKIIPRRVTGNCAKHQRVVTKAKKKSRLAGLMPFSVD